LASCSIDLTIEGFSGNSEQGVNTVLDLSRSSYEKCSKRKCPLTEIMQLLDFGVALKLAVVHTLIVEISVS
jgi:hypothetical protein